MDDDMKELAHDAVHEMSAYQRWEHAKLDDIDHDTDKILEKLEESDMGEGFDAGMLAGLMGNKGVDPGIVALLNDRCRDGGWGWGGDGGMLTLLFLIILLGGRGGFGYGANFDAAGVAGVDRTVVNEANFGQLLDAINGNRNSAERLAQTLNCDVQTINNAIYGVDKQLAINHGDFINAIQSCCCNVRTEILQSQNALQSQLAKCCCDTNLNIERTGNMLQRQMDQCCCDLKTGLQENRFLIQTTDAATRQHLDERLNALSLQVERGFCDQKERELMNRINALEDQRDTLRAEAQTAVLLSSINGTKCFNGRYDTTTSTICGSVGARNCCCNRSMTPTPAPAQAEATAKAEEKSEATYLPAVSAWGDDMP